MKVVGCALFSDNIVPEVGDKYLIKGIVSQDLNGDHVCIIERVGEEYMYDLVLIKSLSTGVSIWYPKAKIRRRDFVGNDCQKCCQFKRRRCCRCCCGEGGAA